MDEKTRFDIDKLVSKAIQKIGFKEPPITLEPLLHELEVNRNFVEMEDPSLIRRFLNRLTIGGEIFTKILKTVKLEGVWFPEEQKILIKTSLPKLKQDWASFHEATHRLLPWHRQYFLGDTAQTLEVDFLEKLESQANYGASALMFGGPMFTKDAISTTPEWQSVELLKTRYKRSLVTTLRRYVEFGHDLPMAMVISTPYWMEIPDDQEDGIRHLVLSNRFIQEFGSINRESILNLISQSSAKRRGGIVGDFQAFFCAFDSVLNCNFVQLANFSFGRLFGRKNRPFSDAEPLAAERPNYLLSKISVGSLAVEQNMHCLTFTFS